ncbi:MAG: DUF459 domain-containing protein [Hyphomicrobium sp.]
MARRIFAALLTFLLAFSFVAADVDFSFAAKKRQQQPQGFLDRLFGPAPPPPPQSRRSRQGGGGAFSNPFLFGPSQPLFGDDNAPIFQRAKRPKKPRAPSEPPLVTAEVQPKDPKARKILVVGDFVAGGLAWGLDQALANEPKLAVIDKSNDGSGLVRPDFFDWNTTLPQVLNSEKPDLVVVVLGANDRQQIRTANERLAVGSTPWEKTYTERLDGMIETLKVYGKPFFWVSAPPMRATSGAGDMAYLNGLYKPRVEAAGGTFVDIWIGFTNATGQYISTGPGSRRPSAPVAHRRRRQLHARRPHEALLLCRARDPQEDRHRRRHRRTPAGDQPDQHHRDRPGRQEAPGRPGDVPIRSGAGRERRARRRAGSRRADGGVGAVRMIVKGDALPEVAGRVDDFAWPPGSRPCAAARDSRDAGAGRGCGPGGGAAGERGDRSGRGRHAAELKLAANEVRFRASRARVVRAGRERYGFRPREADRRSGRADAPREGPGPLRCRLSGPASGKSPNPSATRRIAPVTRLAACGAVLFEIAVYGFKIRQRTVACSEPS